jgi:hypothetical protein
MTTKKRSRGSMTVLNLSAYLYKRLSLSCLLQYSSTSRATPFAVKVESSLVESRYLDSLGRFSTASLNAALYNFTTSGLATVARLLAPGWDIVTVRSLLEVKKEELR